MDTQQNYGTPRNTAYTATEADQAIMEDSTQHYRVFHLQNPFNENRTSTFHRSVGGYHPAKLRRYQDLIEVGLSSEREALIAQLRARRTTLPPMPVCDMLNVKYFVLGANHTDTLRNDSPCGTAWFVQDIVPVEGPDEEIATLADLNPCVQATWDTRAQPLLEETDYATSGEITLRAYTPNEIHYRVQNDSTALLVFSEVYYPEWQAYVNEEPQEILRVNYLLRALQLPAGTHDIRLRMNPARYLQAKRWSWISHIGLLLGMCVLLGHLGYQRRLSITARGKSTEKLPPKPPSSSPA